MAFSTRPRRGLVVVLLVAAAAVLAAPSSVASATTSGPPNGVYTCEWIAAHPAAAAQAQVTCDPVALPSTPFGPTVTPSASSRSMMLMDEGCQYLPTSGSVGQGVFAWTSYKYTTRWSWFGNNTPASYTWYLQTSGGTYAWAFVSDANVHGVNAPANIYRWGAQNHSSTAQYWYVCWSDT